MPIPIDNTLMTKLKQNIADLDNKKKKRGTAPDHSNLASQSKQLSEEYAVRMVEKEQFKKRL